MQLSKVIQITVFQITNTTFEPIGDISQYTSLLWPDAFNGWASFEMWAPITSDNKELIKRGNIIWAGGDNAAIIESIKSTIDDQGEKTYDVKGRTLEKLLADKIILGTFSGSGKASTIMCKLVNEQIINPAKQSRKVPWMALAEDPECGNQIASYQKTGGSVYEALSSLATESDIGFSVLFRPREQKLVFEVSGGVDRTQENADGNDPVVFSTELEDLLSSEYYSNDEDYKNIAFVYGEGSGAERKYAIVGQDTDEGLDRYELYIDARDLQSEIRHEDGTTTQLTDEQYKELLVQRGKEKLAEYTKVEQYVSQIRQFGNVQYIFGENYQKGDKVTVIDEQIGVMVSARITQAEEQFDNEYNLVLTFGYSYPTVLQKVKREQN